MRTTHLWPNRLQKKAKRNLQEADALAAAASVTIADASGMMPPDTDAAGAMMAVAVDASAAEGFEARAAAYCGPNTVTH